MQVYIVMSLLDNEDEIEGVFSTREIAETYISDCQETMGYEDCTFVIIPEVVDQFIN